MARNSTPIEGGNGVETLTESTGVGTPPSETNSPPPAPSPTNEGTPAANNERPIDPETGKPMSDYKFRLHQAGRAEFAVQVPIALRDQLLVKAKEEGDIALAALTRKVLASYVNFDLSSLPEPARKARTKQTTIDPNTGQVVVVQSDPAFQARKERNVAQVALLLYKAGRKPNNEEEIAALTAKMQKLEAATNEDELVAAGVAAKRERKSGEQPTTSE